MDDFVIIVKNKEMAKDIYFKINNYVNSKLHLELNKKSKYYPIGYGCDFCGYIVYRDFIKVRKRSKKNINASIRKWNYLYKCNKFNYHKFITSYNSFISHLKFANTKNYIRVTKNKILYFRNNK